MAGAGKRIAFRVPLDEVNDTFAAAPYDCVLTVRSTGGYRRVKLAGIVPLTDAQEKDWLNKLKLMQAADCPFRVKPIWDIGSLRDGWWLGGDPPAPDDGVRVREYGVGGLSPAETVTLQTLGGFTLSSGVAGASGVAFLTALTSTLDQGRELAIVRPSNAWNQAGSSAAFGVPGGSEQGLAIRKSLWVRRARASLNASCRQLSESRRGLVVTTARGVSVFDLRNPRLPFVRATLARQGAVGAGEWTGDSIITWGAFGVETIDFATRTSVLLCRDPVASGALAKGHNGPTLAVLGGNEIRFFSGTEGDARRMQAPVGSQDVTFAGTTLAVRSTGGIALFDAVTTERLGDIAIAALRFVRPETMVRKPAIALETAEGGVVLDVSDPSQPWVTMRIPGRPWFADSARSGNVLAHVDPNGASLTVYELESFVEELRALTVRPRANKPCRC